MRALTPETRTDERLTDDGTGPAAGERPSPSAEAGPVRQDRVESVRVLRSESKCGSPQVRRWECPSPRRASRGRFPFRLVRHDASVPRRGPIRPFSDVTAFIVVNTEAAAHRWEPEAVHPRLRSNDENGV